jgi:hypothetical protein
MGTAKTAKGYFNMQIRKSAPFSVYKLVYDDGRQLYNYGKLSSAFKDDYGKYTVTLISEHETFHDAKSAHARITRDPVLCHDNNTIYASVEDAARALGLHPQSITHHIAGRPGYARPKGHTFQYIPREAI